MVCPGYAKSVSHERLLLLNNGTVNRNLGFNEVCKEKHVSVAYNNDWAFEVSDKTGKMYRITPARKPREVKINKIVAWEYEIQEAFFESNYIKPHWINCKRDWGTLNQTTGQWSGAVGVIQRDEADYALFDFSGSYNTSKVAAFSPGIDFRPLHWLTRLPQHKDTTWNLLTLFTKG